MFITLLVVTFATAAIVSAVCVKIFRVQIEKIVNRIIPETISAAWSKYMIFAMYVVGISGGVRINSIDRYINNQWINTPAIDLNRDRWILEIYRTVIETLQSAAWLLLVFFVVALIAFVILRVFEIKKGKTGQAFPNSVGGS